ncbi:MAG: galactokinase family protein [Thermoguttaceae bacterium]
MNLEYTGSLSDHDALREAFVAGGLRTEAAARKARLFAKVAGDGFSGDCAFFVPGRIEVLGKHTDYAGGCSMVAAAEQGFCLVARPREDGRVEVIDAGRGESIDFEIGPTLVPRGGHWSNYPMTVARRIARNFPEARRGATIRFASDLPAAAGMSSSTAMIVGVFLALAEANQLAPPADCPTLFTDFTKLAGYLGTVENGQSFGSLVGDVGVGTFGGSEDHTAILCCRANHISRYAYCPVQFEGATALPEGLLFAIATSGVAAEKTAAAREQYNRASRLASALARLWQAETGRDEPHLAAVLASSPDAGRRLQRLVAEADDVEFSASALTARLEHFVVENEELIPACDAALRQGDLHRFGQLVDRSQQAAERLLGNQIPETSFLAASAREHHALAASAFGAGFGGSVWALVETAGADTLLDRWADAYRRQFPQHASASSFFLSGAGPAVLRVC